jgi:hypothetical protein
VGTRSRIGILHEDQRHVTSVYGHWDGYPENMGPLLLDHWNTPEKILSLLREGDFSSLGKELGEKHDFDKFMERISNGTILGGEINPDCPYAKGWTNFYGRDRGEDRVECALHPIDEWPDYSQEFEYLFDGGTWNYRHEGDKAWHILIREGDPE